jgi:ABC-type amino acid transport substrate-binding protein
MEKAKTDEIHIVRSIGSMDLIDGRSHFARRRNMKVTIAYIEEPPFGWTEADRAATGADIDLADTVLRAIGVTRIEHRLTTFSELLPGVEAGRWDMNVPLFVTPERAKLVAFSLPVWAIGDGFLVRAGNPKALNSYASIAERQDAHQWRPDSMHVWAGSSDRHGAGP